jgi:hypothetical protein
MFLDLPPAFGRSVDRRGPTKPSATEILQYDPTGSHALENASNQNAITLLRPKSHTHSYRMLSNWNIDAIPLRLQETDALRLVGCGMASQTQLVKPSHTQSFSVAHSMQLSRHTTRTHSQQFI